MLGPVMFIKLQKTNASSGKIFGEIRLSLKDKASTTYGADA